MAEEAARLDPDGRAAALAALTGDELQVLVVGGGVVGAGVALDAVTRGLSVGLVEARDFASGTSSRSSKLIHGGLRYLEQLNVSLVREALTERGLLLQRIAPHLVRPVPFLFPLTHHVWERAYVGAGLNAYDALGFSLGQQRGLPGHRQLTKRGALRLAPALKRSVLTGALNHIGKKAMLCLREPSLGPCFGVKGGAAGGGYAQVVPMEDINLHFTGDFHAITSAHNLLSALVDNHIYWGNELGIDSRRVVWRRVMDMNDRALREIVCSLGGVANGYPREAGFDITVASEIMAIFCLASDLDDLKERIGNIIVAYTRDRKPVRARDLKAHGAMTVLLKEALAPNLVQTLEGTPAFIHGGPFANIAHGCNSVLATTTALKLCDYVVTEAGFGADLGGEKFLDIKCRKTGLAPAAAVLVATIRALKMHGGVKKEDLKTENLKALEAGMANLARHVENVQKFGIVPIISINRFSADTDAEIALVEAHAKKLGVEALMADHWAEGGKGAADVARAVVKVVDSGKSKLKLLYPDEMPLLEKVRTIAKEIYRAKDISADKPVRDQLAQFEQMGYGKLPVCIAKTQYSFTTNGDMKGAPNDHTINVREVKLSAGAEFVVAICGEIMTMPGLPRVPAADAIDVGADGRIVGLF